MSAQPLAASGPLSLFERVARDSRLPAPRPVTCSAEEWGRHCRAVWARFPAWGYDRAYLTEAARPFLPRVLAHMGFGRALGRVSDTPDDAVVHGIPLPDAAADWSWRWLTRHAPGPALVPLRSGSPWASGLALRLSSEPEAALLFLCEVHHDWHCPGLARQGEDLTDLGAWRWGISEAKAAHRIARLCGLRRPVP